MLFLCRYTIVLTFAVAIHSHVLLLTSCSWVVECSHFKYGPVAAVALLFLGKGFSKNIPQSHVSVLAGGEENVAHQREGAPRRGCQRREQTRFPGGAPHSVQPLGTWRTGRVCSGEGSHHMGNYFSHTVWCLRCLFWKQIHLLLKKKKIPEFYFFSLRELNSYVC